MTLDDIDDEVRTKVYTQKYGHGNAIEGVKIVPLKNSISDEGDFSEIMRFKNDGELEAIPGFKIAQINRTRVFANSIKAWHIHFKQDEIWYIPPEFHLFVGLWDIRKKSPTNKQTMRINLGGTLSHFLYIPHGVAHGSANFSNKPIELFYFVNQQFDVQDPDEKRIPWDSVGTDFWTPEKD